MRLELALDFRNEGKHTVSLDRADAIKARAIVYVAMLIPNIGRHGKLVRPWPGARPDVAMFYATERAAQRKDLSRLSQLDPRYKLFLMPYSAATRRPYWRALAEFMADLQGPRLFLVDPCNGVAARPGKLPVRNLRVVAEDLAELWSSMMRPGDALLTYQTPEWCSRPFARASELLSSAADGAPVTVHRVAGIGMLEVRRLNLRAPGA
jgi:hypothetical protein